MHNILNYSIQIISTNKVVRSETLISALNKYEMPFEISPGVVPTVDEFDLGIFHSKYISSLICQRRITKAEVGCAVAHQNAIKNFLNTESEFGIIFEDDCEIYEFLDLKVITNFLATSKPRVLLLGWIPGYAVIYPDQIQLDPDTYSVVTPPTCAFGYALNKSAADLFIASKKVLDLADWPIQTLKKIEFAIPRTSWVLAPQDPSNSIIGVREKNTRKTFSSNIKSRMRLILSIKVLMVIKMFCKLPFTYNEIFHRVLLKNFIYNFGVSAITQGHGFGVKKDIVELPLKYAKILKALKFI